MQERDAAKWNSSKQQAAFGGGWEMKKFYASVGGGRCWGEWKMGQGEKGFRVESENKEKVLPTENNKNLQASWY